MRHVGDVPPNHALQRGAVAVAIGASRGGGRRAWVVDMAA
jgi:hypothetical protein